MFWDATCHDSIVVWISGDQLAESATVIDTLQQHNTDEPQEYVLSSPKCNVLVYPVVLLLGCVIVLVWRKFASPKLSWSRRRLPVSRYEV